MRCGERGRGQTATGRLWTAAFFLVAAGIGLGEGVRVVTGRHRLRRPGRARPRIRPQPASARATGTEVKTTDAVDVRVPTAVTGPTVEVHALTVTYGQVAALDAVDARFVPGALTAVTGASGAGKSSLLWAVAGGLDRGAVAGGSVTIDNAVVDGRRQTLGWGVAVLPQGNGLASVLTASENCLVPLLELGVGADEALVRVKAALSAVGLEDSGNHLIEELSGGQQQRVAVARALAVRPRLLLADEPTSELDHHNRELVLDLLGQLAKGGCTIVMATHDPEAAAAASGEVGLDEGRVVMRR